MIEAPTSVRTAFSFLTAGPRFAVAIPAEFGSIAELSSPLANPNGARSFDFLPSGRSNGIPENYSVVDTLIDPAGRSVNLYRWPYDPPQWYLEWSLANGALWTHLREEDGTDMASVTVDALRIIEAPNGSTPVVVVRPPLRLAVSGRPGYQETAVFTAADHPAWMITLARPPYLSAGQVVARPDSPSQFPVVRAGTRVGLEIQIAGTDLQQVKDQVAVLVDSIAEA